MLKTFMFSLSLAVALGVCSVSKAGGLDSNCTTCGLASPQGGPYASGQGIATGCESPCAPKKHHFSFHLPKINCSLPKLQHNTSYEWVLKKKHSFCLVKAPHGGDACACWSCLRDGSGFSVRPGGHRSFGPGWLWPGSLRGSSGLWCWPACFPACQARNLDRVRSCRDDPGGPWW